MAGNEVNMRAKITFEVEIPEVDYSTQELVDWLRYEYRDTGGLDGKNPFINFEPEPVFGTFFVDELF
jgi:hypothetical protein